VIAGTFRRLAAGVYDGLLILAVLMISTAILQALNHGEAITYRSVGAWEYVYRAVLAAAVATYFGIAWTRRGQTLGMKAWSLRVERTDGALLRWPDVLRRLGCSAPLHLLAIAGVLAYMTKIAGAAALIGCCVPLIASYAWLVARRTATLHDLLSRTRVVRLEKSK
jgi:uncharacterized RDD family membrane protein YckC